MTTIDHGRSTMEIQTLVHRLRSVVAEGFSNKKAVREMDSPFFQVQKTNVLSIWRSKTFPFAWGAWPWSLAPLGKQKCISWALF
jgi:hypothetical protein